ncbi:MAG: zinc finger protein [Pseudonocardiaceae bacterium]
MTAPALGADHRERTQVWGYLAMYMADQQTSRPFVWFPLSGQRHAIDRRDRNVPLGTPMRCLCGASHPRSVDGDMEWLWKSCEQCWDET